jgi:hypothetical protein
MLAITKIAPNPFVFYPPLSSKKSSTSSNIIAFEEPTKLNKRKSSMEDKIS